LRRPRRELDVDGFVPIHAVVEYSYEQLLALEPGVMITGVEAIASP
jgi:hypothetical protein